MTNTADLRKSYERAELSEDASHADPLKQFAQWLDEAIAASLPEPNAMTLATVAGDLRPSSGWCWSRGTTSMASSGTPTTKTARAPNWPATHTPRCSFTGGAGARSANGRRGRQGGRGAKRRLFQQRPPCCVRYAGLRTASWVKLNDIVWQCHPARTAGLQPGPDLEPRHRLGLRAQRAVHRHRWGRPQSSGVGRARVGCAAVRWQGGDDAAGSPAREEEQRRQRAAARLNRVRSTSTQQARAVVNTNRNVHAMLPAVTSGQLRLPG